MTEPYKSKRCQCGHLQILHHSQDYGAEYYGCLLCGCKKFKEKKK